MALVLADRVLETTAVAGTGDAALAGAITGYQPFSVIGGGNTTYYTIVAIDDNGAPTGDWEVGIGTYVTTGNKLTRDTVLSSSNGGAKVYFASGTKQIFLDLPSEEVTNGNVIGPASAVADNFASFNMTTGKLIKDSGYNASSFATAAQGAKADTAVQPGSLGTAAYLNAGVANGVATLDSGGQVPLSQIPPLGDLNYQGAWNASSNTPTLVSSSGTKGYYYVVSVAGSTNLNGITDWNVGDWAVFNGSVWQKIDNTDSVTSVNGKTGTVVLTYSDVGAFPATATTGTGNVVLASGASITGTQLTNSSFVSPTNFVPTTAPTYAQGNVWYDSTANGLAYQTDVNGVTIYPGQEVAQEVYNQTGSTINAGSVVYITGQHSQQPTIALAKADALSTSNAIGIVQTNIANNANGYITVLGFLGKLNTSGFTAGDTLYLSATTAGAITNTAPTSPNYAVRVGFCTYSNPSNGDIFVSVRNVYVNTNNMIGQVPVANGGTGASTLTGLVKGNGTSAFTAAVSGTDYAPATSGTSILYGNGSGGFSPVTIGSGVSFSAGTLSATGSGGTVTSVSGTAPIASTGGATPTISISQASGSTNGYLSSTDWTTFNNKGSGSVTSVGGTGTVNGITLTGTVTSSGNLTLGGTLSNVSLTSQVTGTLPIANGGTNATSAPAAYANIFGFTTTATAAGTTTLTNTSTIYQLFTGTTTQTIVLPVTSTLAQGWTFNIVNTSTGTLTVNSSGSNLVVSIPTNSSAVLTCVLTSGTTAASWVNSSSSVAVWGP